MDEKNRGKKDICIYQQKNMLDILAYYKKTGKTFWEMVYETEGETVKEHLSNVWGVMKKAIENGLQHEGLLPGGLKLQRKAVSYYAKSKELKNYAQITSRIFAYALAVAEENASGGEVVTAPTCGSAGILPAVLKMSQEHFKIDNDKILRALATAGLVGNIVKYNASISDRKSTRLNSSHTDISRMPSSA